MSIITLTTDFGTSDHYVAQMKGVILGINPQATIVDISHAIAPQDIPQGAGVIGEAHRSFPAGTIHVVVVDPGVGTGRRPILLSTPNAHFVGPDNGVLSHILSEGFGDPPQLSEDGMTALPTGFRGIHLNNPDSGGRRSASPSMAGTSSPPWPPICPWESRPPAWAPS